MLASVFMNDHRSGVKTTVFLRVLILLSRQPLYFLFVNRTRLKPEPYRSERLRLSGRNQKTNVMTRRNQEGL